MSTAAEEVLAALRALGWADDHETFKRQFWRRTANYVLQTKPLDVPPEQTALKVLGMGPLRSDRA